jgi:hypothetical protein
MLIWIAVKVNDVSSGCSMATFGSCMFAIQVAHLTLPPIFAPVTLTAATQCTVSIQADADYGETRFDPNDCFSIAIAELDQVESAQGPGRNAWLTQT